MCSPSKNVKKIVAQTILRSSMGRVVQTLSGKPVPEFVVLTRSAELLLSGKAAFRRHRGPGQTRRWGYAETRLPGTSAGVVHHVGLVPIQDL